MDYIMKISMVIDTEAKKTAIRDNLKTQLTTAYTTGTIKSWAMDITGILVPGEDNESYTSPTTP
jgi:hypothetical protein